jgi:hypothetical protein
MSLNASGIPIGSAIDGWLVTQSAGGYRVPDVLDAPPLERLAEGRLALDPLRLGVDVREADLDVLRPGVAHRRTRSRR